MVESSHAARKRKFIPSRNPISPRETSEFKRIHFPTSPLAKRFETRFMGRKVIDSYYVDLYESYVIALGVNIRYWWSGLS